jgi:ribosome recycling factor
MKKSIESLELELNTIRVGRANPHVLDKITVNYFGADTPLNQVGNISVPDPRMLVIQPWDSSLLKHIEKAIQASDLGINPTNDGKLIRLVFPELTEERRKQLSKEVKKKGEDFKVAVRNIRRDGMDSFKKKQKKSEITEDELKQFEEDLQKLTDKYISEVEKRLDVKSKEIMSI